MSKEEIALEAWNLVKKLHDEGLSEEEHGELYKYLIVLMGDDILYESLKDAIEKMSKEKGGVLNVKKIIEEAIGIGFDEKDFDEIMEYTEKGNFETVQDAIMNAIRTCVNK